jgi:hypothetical protein
VQDLEGQDGGGLLDDETENLLYEIETLTAAALRETAQAGRQEDSQAIINHTLLTLSYSSKINGYLYHQRVSPPLKKTP